MTGVIKINMTPVMGTCYLGDYTMLPFYLILSAIGAKKE